MMLFGKKKNCLNVEVRQQREQSPEQTQPHVYSEMNANIFNPDIVKKLASDGYLKRSDCKRLASANKFFYTHLKDRIKPAAGCVSTLLQLVIFFGDAVSVNDMLIEDPGWLLERNPIKDHVGRVKNMTAFQLAWSARDFGMCKMMLTHFAKLPDGMRQAWQQINEMFPDDNMTRKPFDGFEELLKVINVSKLEDILNVYEDEQGSLAKNSKLKLALDKFRKYFDEYSKSENIWYFNFQDLISVYKIFDKYNHKRKYWGKQGSGHGADDFFWVKVVGTVQRYMPAWSWQAHIQQGESKDADGYKTNGIENLVARKEALHRRFEYQADVFRNGVYMMRECKIMQTKPDCGLGYEHAFNMNGHAMMHNRAGDAICLPYASEAFAELYKRNERGFAELRNQMQTELKNETQSRNRVFS